MSETSEKPSPKKIEDYIRLAFSRDENGDVEIISCATKTTILIPEQDIELLISGLTDFHLHRTESEPEIVSLYPSLETCECGKI